jgi:hypothetical protein
MTRLVLAFTVLALVAMGVVAASCLDTTPITVPPRDAGLLADASCSTCLYTPQACQPTIDDCRADPGCRPILECVEAARCFDAPTIDDKVSCGVPCLVDAGITNVDDPRVDRLLGVIRCGQKACALPCNLGDGGIPGLSTRAN